MRTKIKLFSYLLCCVMLIGLMSSTAYAASPEEIKSFSLSFIGAAMPEVGNSIKKPDSSLATKVNDNRLKLTQNVPYWKDENGEIINDTTTDGGVCFEAGRTYSATLVVQVREPDYYCLTQNTKVTLTGYSGFSYTAKLVNIFTTINKEQFADIRLTITMDGQRSYPTIDKVMFEDAPIPKNGDSCASAKTGIYYNNCTKTSDEWYNQTEWASQFVSGQTYTRVIVLTAKPGYKFNKNVNVVLAHDGILKEPNVKTLSSNDTVLTLKYNYLIGRIPKVELEVYAPEEGREASTWVDNLPAGCDVVSVDWYEDNSLKTGTFKFAAGKTYRIAIKLTANNGIEFLNPLEKATINGKQAGVTAYGGNIKKGILLTYTFEKLSDDIQCVELSVEQPVAGAYQDASVPMLMTDDVSIYAYEWYKDGERLTVFDTFQAGQTYTLKARLTTIKKFTNDVVVKVNDDDAYVLSVDNNQSILFEYYFALPVTKVTVTLNANGGTVLPNAVKKNVGEQLGSLPTPTRDGYIFDSWFTEPSGGTKVATYTAVTSDITLYAHWIKEKPDEPVYNDLVEAFVARLYNECLLRAPEAAGLADWTNQLKSGTLTGTGAAYGIVFSQEYKNRSLCNEDFVENLYNAFMGRKSDAAGKADWVGRLESGVSREAVFNGFAMSTEFSNLCAEYGILVGNAIAEPQQGTGATGKCSVCGKDNSAVSDGVTAFVTRLYTICLGRTPDEHGLTDWTSQLRNHTKTGRSVAYGFIFSQEFTNKNLNNSDYVECLYKAFFDRPSDAGGKADWMNKLNMGWSREQVFDGFVGSQEFTNLCNKYGITRD